MAGPKSSRRVGLARALSKLGFCSRSRAAQLIRAGSVTLNGIRRDPETPVNLERDKIAINGRGLAASSKIYVMLNKPRGIVTTAADEQGRKTVYSCLPRDLPWLAPVGRLDKASEGLLLLTNDSKWAARILAPDSHLDKTYHVQVVGPADTLFCESLVKGLTLDEGQSLRMTRARVLRVGQRNVWLEVVLDEGKNRHIRRMMDQLGREVLRLIRVGIGPITLGELPKGASRPLTAIEKENLDKALAQRQKRSSPLRASRANSFCVSRG